MMSLGPSLPVHHRPRLCRKSPSSRGTARHQQIAPSCFLQRLGRRCSPNGPRCGWPSSGSRGCDERFLRPCRRFRCQRTHVARSNVFPRPKIQSKSFLAMEVFPEQQCVSCFFQRGSTRHHCYHSQNRSRLEIIPATAISPDQLHRLSSANIANASTVVASA